MADKDDRCKHQGCTCAVNNNEEYCSAVCEAAGEQGMTGIACDCGHSGCGGEIDQ